jgi:hypothetical protein
VARLLLNGAATDIAFTRAAVMRNLFLRGAAVMFESGLPDTVTPTGYTKEPSEDEDLAKKSQNPIADLVSVPFQSDTNFNAGPFNRTQEVLDIQPVVPLHINADWNLISRTIMPVISQPSPVFDSNTNGIGDITQEFFFSPTHPGPLIWGLGPLFIRFRPRPIRFSEPVGCCWVRPQLPL